MRFSIALTFLSAPCDYTGQHTKFLRSWSKIRGVLGQNVFRMFSQVLCKRTPAPERAVVRVQESWQALLCPAGSRLSLLRARRLCFCSLGICPVTLGVFSGAFWWLRIARSLHVAAKKRSSVCHRRSLKAGEAQQPRARTVFLAPSVPHTSPEGFWRY